MADLMKAKTVTYDELVRKYDNFLVPAFKIKIKGKDVIASMKLTVENVSIVSSLDTAGSLNFTIVNLYDKKKREFKKEVLSQFKLGTVLDAEIGYGSKTTLVFKGYVSETSADFSDDPTLTVTAMDVRKLMMENRERFKVHKTKNYGETFKAVMAQYKKLCTFLEVDATQDQLGEDGVSQTSSDFKFVKNDLARKSDREFFVLAGKAYFRIPQKVKEPITTLSWGKNLISFQRRASYTFAKFQVVGQNEETEERFVGEVTIKSKDPQIAVLSNPEPTVISDPDATDVKKAKRRAKAAADKKMSLAQEGSGECVGLPELIPGRFVKLEHLGGNYDHNYYIKKVRHSFGSDGFTTSFDIGGWE